MSKLTKVFLIVLIMFSFASGIANTTYAIFSDARNPNLLLSIGMASFLMSYLLNEEIILREEPRDDETF